jgi:hypothetical protein
MTTLEQQVGNAIRPFTVHFREAALADLRRRLTATRWPTEELVGDRSQAVIAAERLKQERTSDKRPAYRP